MTSAESSTRTSPPRNHVALRLRGAVAFAAPVDRKSTRLNSSHANISYAVFCLKKKKINNIRHHSQSARRDHLLSPPWHRIRRTDQLAYIDGDESVARLQPRITALRQ